MRVEFFDRENESNPINGSTFDSDAELLLVLKVLRQRTPFFCELVGDNGRNLLIGLGPELNCVQYSSSDGEPPYFVALGPNENAGENQDLEFFMGGQLSEVPAHYGLGPHLVDAIASHFLRTGERSPLVPWESL